MIRGLLPACLLCLVPMQALADWVHGPTGIRIPDAIGEMRKGEVRDLTNGSEANVLVQYGNADEPVTLYVYRSSHPSPALWFERTQIAMRTTVGEFGGDTLPVAVSLFGSATPNAMRQSYTLGDGKGWRATGVAMAGHGEWLVKARITSRTLDAAGVAAKMDRLLAAIEAPALVSPAMVDVAPCPAPGRYRDASPVTGKAAADDLPVAAVTGVVVMAEARGIGGLVNEPAKWCREPQPGLPAQIATVYRERDGNRWVSLIGDSGSSASGYDLIDVTQGMAAKDGRAAVYLSDASATRVLAVADTMPSPERAFTDYVLPVLTGKRQPLASIAAKPKPAGAVVAP